MVQKVQLLNQKRSLNQVDFYLILAPPKPKPLPPPPKPPAPEPKKDDSIPSKLSQIVILPKKPGKDITKP